MTKPANAFRGEASLTIGKTKFILRPSFENLVAAEDEVGSLFSLIERASEGSLKIAEISGMLWHCLPHQGRPPREELEDAILEIGLVKSTEPVRAILAQVIQGQA